jgi:hypothetical protein
MGYTLMMSSVVRMGGNAEREKGTTVMMIMMGEAKEDKNGWLSFVGRRKDGIGCSSSETAEFA